MTARMRWGPAGGDVVPWLATLIAVLLVASLAWLTTDEPSMPSTDDAVVVEVPAEQ